MPATNEEVVQQLLTLDATLGYMKRRLANADYSDPFIKGYAAAYGDLAHIRNVVWWDWRRRDPAAASGHAVDWDSIAGFEWKGAHRIFKDSEEPS